MFLLSLPKGTLLGYSGIVGIGLAVDIFRESYTFVNPWYRQLHPGINSYDIEASAPIGRRQIGLTVSS